MSLQLVFQGGNRIVETISTTAGNVVTNLSPGAGKKWIVLFGRITLTTNGTVVNRYLEIRYTDGTNITNMVAQGNVQTAGLTNNYSFGTRVINTDHGDNDYMLLNNLPLFEGADQFRIAVMNGVAGDNYSGFVVILEVSV